MNLLDRAISYVSPSWAAKRTLARLALAQADHFTRKYDAASKGRRTSGWRGTSTSANTETASAGPLLRDRARDAERNNGRVEKALSVIEGNVVGTGIMCQPKSSNKRRAKKALDLWQTWAETTACDFEGHLDFYGLQSLAIRTAARDGECLMVFRRVVGTPGVPLQLQLLEADYFDTSRTAGADGNDVIQGIEVNSDGKPVAYWLYKRHPGDVSYKGRALESQRVPVEQVVHLFAKKRAGQLRGVSWLAPVLLRLNDLDDYEDAQLIRQKIASCFAVFVSDTMGEDVPAALGVQSDPGEPMADRMEPGMVEHLPPGKQVTFGKPPGVDGYEEYVRSNLRTVAGGIGLTYEALSGDYSQTSYSSGRMGWVEFHRNIERWRWLMLIPQLCDRVWRAFVEAAAINGINLSGVEATWTPPRREMIAPKEEVQAAIAAIRSGIKSWSEVVREFGYDPLALLDELRDDAEAFEAAGLVLDCDPRKTTQQGQAQREPVKAKPAEKGAE